MYIATAFIGQDYTPGEVLHDDLDEALIMRLLKAGAIKETAPVREAMTATINAGSADTPIKGDGDAEAAGTFPKQGIARIPGARDGEGDEETEPEPPEIDAAEALIPPAEPKAEKPAPRKRGPKGGGGK